MNQQAKKLLEQAQQIIIKLKNELEYEDLKEQQKKSLESTSHSKLMSYRDVLKYFEISHKTLTDYIKKGLIQPAIPGRKKFYKKEDVIKLMKLIKGFVIFRLSPMQAYGVFRRKINTSCYRKFLTRHLIIPP